VVACYPDRGLALPNLRRDAWRRHIVIGPSIGRECGLARCTVLGPPVELLVLLGRRRRRTVGVKGLRLARNLRGHGPLRRHLPSTISIGRVTPCWLMLRWLHLRGSGSLELSRLGPRCRCLLLGIACWIW
jgi:hypothetical protein